MSDDDYEVYFRSTYPKLVGYGVEVIETEVVATNDSSKTSSHYIIAVIT